MATEAKIRANRRNAQKSTGPRSSEGKSIVSQNAVKHGLLARQAVISTENQVEFEIYRDRMLRELAPAGPMESMLAERIVTLSWRLKRTECIQNQVIDAKNKDNQSQPFAKLAQSFLPKSLRKKQDESAPDINEKDLALGHVAIKDFSDSRVLDRLLMYERRIEHSLYKTIIELQRRRLLRKLDNPEKTDQETEFQLLLGG